MTVPAAEIERAAEVLRGGGLVAFPTETVYGLGAAARDEAAVGHLFAVKGRPPGHPVIVHLGDPSWLSVWAAAVPEVATQLAAAFWPGPLSLVVTRSAAVPDAVTGGRATVGLRVPDQAVARALLAAFGDGIAAPSANRFGRVSPTTAEAVRAELDAEVDLILDDGPCAIGVESTIVDCTTDPAVVLRPGGISLEQLRLVVGESIAVERGGPSRAPGMLASHYAPRCRVELVEDEGAARARLAQLTAAGASAELLGMGTDAETYAHNLYAWLRGADDRMVDVVVAVLPSEEGIGRAVRDRLAKAAAARR